MRPGSYTAWTVRAEDFPRAGNLEDQLRFLLRYAILAPSAHNTQPWRFTLRGNRLQVGLDSARVLTVSDPTQREAVLSLGACVENFCLAAAHFGFRTVVAAFPPGDPSVVAEISLTADPGARTASGDRLVAAIPQRHANRALFEARPLQGELVAEFRALASGEGVRVHLVVERVQIAALADITGRAVAASMGQPAFRRELACWVRNNYTKRPDGMPGFAVGVPGLPSLLAPVMVQLPPMARAEAKKRRAQVASAPLVAVITARADDRLYWLRAGMLLERLWLTATAAGLRVGVLAAAIETGEFPAEVARVLDTDERPVAFARIGYGPPDPHPTPRRNVADALAG